MPSGIWAQIPGWRNHYMGFLESCLSLGLTHSFNKYFLPFTLYWLHAGISCLVKPGKPSKQ